MSATSWCIIRVNGGFNRKWFGRYQCGTVHATQSEQICRYRTAWASYTYKHLLKRGEITLEEVEEGDYPFAEHP